MSSKHHTSVLFFCLSASLLLHRGQFSTVTPSTASLEAEQQLPQSSALNRLKKRVILTLHCRSNISSAYFNQYRCECVQAGTGRDHCERKGLSKTHQDLGAVWSFYEDPQRSKEVSLTDYDCWYEKKPTKNKWTKKNLYVCVCVITKLTIKEVHLLISHLVCHFTCI